MRPTERFSNRVDDYARWRPDYPDDLFETLRVHAALSARSTVADVGSGTGIATDGLLGLGCTVFGVEPNTAMRAAAEARLGDQPRFHSVNGTAEATTLPDASMDLVAVGQAFHWFDPARAREEFRRILKRRGGVALFWNTRRTRDDPFMRDYAALLDTYGTDYHRVSHENLTPDQLEAFFGGPYQAMVFDNAQELGRDGLRGRLLSSSYVPGPGDPQVEPMLTRLEEIFEAHQQDGKVKFAYDTELFLGKL